MNIRRWLSNLWHDHAWRRCGECHRWFPRHAFYNPWVPGVGVTCSRACCNAVRLRHGLPPSGWNEEG